MKFASFGSWHINDGTEPVKMLCEISNCSTVDKPERLHGSDPVM